MKKQDLHPFAAQAGYKDNESFLRDYPTEDHYFSAFPEMKQGGFVQKKGHHWNGQKMVKNKGNTYNPYTGGFFEFGGNVARAYTEKQMQEVPDNWKMYGGDVDAAVPDEMKSGGIQINPKNKGKFNATKKATGKSTEELTHSSNPVTRKRAIFAQNASHWKKKEYGGTTFTDWDDRMLKFGGNPFSPLREFAGGGEIDDVYGSDVPGNFTSYDPTNTGVVPEHEQTPAPWMQGMHNGIQAKQNIDYGAGSADAYNMNTGNTLDIYKPQPQKPQYGNIIRGTEMVARGIENRQEQKRMQPYLREQGQSDYAVTKTTNPFGHGAYDPNYGQLVPGNTYASKYGGKKMQQGGEVPQLQKGSVVDLDEAEISKYLRMGFKFAKA